MKYISRLNLGRTILWCYFIWYSVFVALYFDSNSRLWLTSGGLAAIVGFALVISTAPANAEKIPLGFWQTFRLFLMPFCVSSFAALVKNRGFILIFSPKQNENLIALGLCLVFCGFVLGVKWAARKLPRRPA